MEEQHPRNVWSVRISILPGNLIPTSHPPQLPALQGKISVATAAFLPYLLIDYIDYLLIIEFITLLIDYRITLLIDYRIHLTIVGSCGFFIFLSI